MNHSALTSSTAGSRDELALAKQLDETERDLWRALLSNEQINRKTRRALAESLAERGKRLSAEIARELDPDRTTVNALIDGLDAFRPSTGLVDAVARTNRQALSLRRALASAHVQLVYRTAREFDHGLMPRSDLIQEGHIGLLKAVGRFDYRRGVRFSTYAVWWIRYAMRRSLADKGRLVRLPSSVIKRGYQMSKIGRELASALGRQPSAEELADATSMSLSKIDHLQRSMAQLALPLSRPTDDQDDGAGPAEPESTAPSPAELVQLRNDLDRLTRSLDCLTPIEAAVVRHRYGLDDLDVSTLSDLGSRYGVSRERIRQIQVKALSKLRERMVA
jgi:RNA polymerase primary sigma factor